MVPPGEGTAVIKGFSDIPSDFKEKMAIAERKNVSERILKLTDGDIIENLPQATFENLTDSPDVKNSGIESFNISTYNGQDNKVAGVRVFLYFDKDNYRDYISFDINKEGIVGETYNQTIPDRISQKIGGKRAIDFAKVITSELERLKGDETTYSQKSIVDLLPESDETEIGPGKDKLPGGDPYRDVRREVMLKMLQIKKLAVFNIEGTPIRGGRGYYQCLICDYGLFLDNLYTKNAAFKIDIRESSYINEQEWVKDVADLRRTLTPESSESQKDEIMHRFQVKYTAPLFMRSKSRDALKQNENAEKIEHRGDWEDKVINTITNLTIRAE
ncbi:MAG: hypothetical protein WCP14_01325 [bacterium]